MAIRSSRLLPSDFLRAEGAKWDSPGQRPGKRDVKYTPAPTGRNNSAQQCPINPKHSVRRIRPRVSPKIHGTHSETIVCCDVLFDWQCNSSLFPRWIG